MKYPFSHSKLVLHKVYFRGQHNVVWHHGLYSSVLEWFCYVLLFYSSQLHHGATDECHSTPIHKILRGNGVVIVEYKAYSIDLYCRIQRPVSQFKLFHTMAHKPYNTWPFLRTVSFYTFKYGFQLELDCHIRICWFGSRIIKYRTFHLL